MSANYVWLSAASASFHYTITTPAVHCRCSSTAKMARYSRRCSLGSGKRLYFGREFKMAAEIRACKNQFQIVLPTAAKYTAIPSLKTEK